MKMVRSLLLGSAAGLVAVAGAQAADLPVKAKPVEYVKICSLYGVGFYYIPGTDMCIKIGGWVRAEAAWGTNGSSVATFNSDLNNRSTNNDWWRVRGYITADARNQTEYGTVRSYIAIGVSTNTLGSNDNAANQFDANRAFIQWAGFTFGRAQSFFDFYSAPATSYFGWFPSSDTGDPGKEVMAYTAQFGNGFSASLSAESPRKTQIINQNAFGAAGAAGGVISGGSFSANAQNASFGAYGGFNVPDIVANLRVDQAWGSAQIMGALHEVNATYYTYTGPALFGGLANTEGGGNPGNKWGFAVGAGFKLNTPWLLNWLGTGAGDYFQTQVNYTQGALRYIFFNMGNGNIFLQDNQGSLAYGIISDGIYGGSLAGANTTDIELTTAWNINAAYEHFWNPRWRTSIHGGYAAVTYGDRANAMLCSAQGGSAAFKGVNGTGLGSLAVATPGCDNNWNWWWIGTRTQWNVTKDFYLGVDVAYTKISPTSTFNSLSTTNMIAGATNQLPRVMGDQDNWSARFRVHRDFYP